MPYEIYYFLLILKFTPFFITLHNSDEKRSIFIFSNTARIQETNKLAINWLFQHVQYINKYVKKLYIWLHEYKINENVLVGTYDYFILCYTAVSIDWTIFNTVSYANTWNILMFSFLTKLGKKETNSRHKRERPAFGVHQKTVNSCIIGLVFFTSITAYFTSKFIII